MRAVLSLAPVEGASSRGADDAQATRTSLRHALELGAAAWDGLLPRAAAPFGGWAWHRAWTDTALAGEVNASEALLLHGTDGALRAVLPVLLRQLRFRRVAVRALTWASGDDGCPDHLDVLADPGADLGALVPALEAIPWQVAILSNLAAEAPNAERLCAALARRGHAVRRRTLWECPHLALPSDWDAYLATLSPTRRQTVRRKDRGLCRRHAVTLTDYPQERFDEGWSHLLRLHAQRWKGEGAFSNPRLEQLQRQFAQEMARQQRLWLSTLDVDGEPAAAWYGFSSDDTVYFYQSGRAPRWERESVGLVLMARMIRRAIERGYKWFDLLRGEDSYKRQWTQTQRLTQEIVIFRSGWSGRWISALDWAAELRGRLWPRPPHDGGVG
ncbi:MAG TPA: GNAT family N-acetyltransferase [Gemmatimonadales bacterium]|nr:GNAT family N-acetyltransferase [Gemmatimonadales bacterium]